MDDLVAYIKQLEDALLSAPLVNPMDARTVREKGQVDRQMKWLHKHNDVLQRARGARIDAVRERERGRQEVISKLKLIGSRVRMMDLRHQYGDPSAVPLTGSQTIELIQAELSRM